MTAPLQPLILRRHAFAAPELPVFVRGGQSIRAMLVEAAGTDAITDDLIVRVGGHVVPASHWSRLRPKPGTSIQVTRDALAGGGDTWRMVLMVVVAAVATWATAGGAAGSFGAAFGAGTVGAAALGAGIMIAGSLLVNALVPPAQASSPASTEGRWNQLTGTSNAINPWGVIPFVIGEQRWFPPHAALPYTQVVGTTSYQHCLFDLGHGDLENLDVRIGDTPIDDFDEVQYEFTRTPTLYQNSVSELVVNSAMVAGDTIQRTSEPDVDAIGFDFVFPAGLFWVNDKNKAHNLEARFNVAWRAVGEPVWQQVPARARRSGFRRVSGAEEVRVLNKKPFGAGISWDVPVGQYEIRITRLPINDGDTRNTYVQMANWTVLRSIKYTAPSSTGTNKLALRIRSSERMSGTLQSLNLITRQRVPVYDRATGTWSTPQVTRNPGWVVHWLLTACPAFSKSVPAKRVNLENMADYAEFCALHGLEVRMVCDAGITARDLIAKVLSGALGSLGNRDGRYAVVYDHGDTQETMAWTPMETRNFRISRPFTRLPHALRVQFKNVDADWQEDELVVPRDGYSHRGKDARGNPSSLPPATDFEVLRVEMAMHARQAWRLARYHFAQAEFRPAVYSFDSDHAGLGVFRGDVNDVASDVAEWGAGWGRVDAIVPGGPDGAAATVTLSERIATQPGQLYGMQFRTEYGGKVLAYATPHSVDTDTFYLTTMPASVGEGDAAILGLRGQETTKLLITDVEYSGDLTTEFTSSFTAVAYDARVLPYWSNPPATLVSEIGDRAYGLPAPPVITGVVSNVPNDSSDDAGIPVPSIHIGIRDRGGYLDVPHQVMAR